MPLWGILAIMAPFIGSFLGVLIMRMPDGRSVIFGHSSCDMCSHKLNMVDLIPLASFIWLRGKCRYCREAIGYFFPCIEIAALFVVLWASTETTGVALIASCVLGWLLLALALIDARAYVLPNALTLPLFVSGLAVSFLIERAHITDHLVGAIIGFLFFILVATLYRAIRKQEGLGMGDAKLLAGLGAWVGWQGLAGTILYASALGCLFVLSRIAMGRPMQLGDKIPFGIFLAAGGWFVWLYGPLVLG